MAKASRTRPQTGLGSLSLQTEQIPELQQSNIDTDVLEAGPEIKESLPVDEMIEQSMSAREILSNASLVGSLNKKVDTSKKTYRLHVSLRKITKFMFRLGMEKTEEQYQLVPGTGQTFVPWMQGDNYMTGLEDKPEVRKRLEAALRVDLSPSSKFYEDLTFRMEDRPNGQLLVIEEGHAGARLEVIYYAMIASPIVANGLQEYSNGLKPMAEWYIENKEAEAEANNREITNEVEAFNLFSAISPTRKSQIAKILGLKVWGLREDVVKSTLWTYLKSTKPTSQGVNTINKFLEVAKKDDTTIAVKSLIEDAIHFNVIRVNAARDFIYGEENLGGSRNAMEEKLLSPKNAQLRAGIEERVNIKNV